MRIPVSTLCKSFHSCFFLSYCRIASVLHFSLPYTSLHLKYGTIATAVRFLRSNDRAYVCMYVYMYVFHDEIGFSKTITKKNGLHDHRFSLHSHWVSNRFYGTLLGTRWIAERQMSWRTLFHIKLRELRKVESCEWTIKWRIHWAIVKECSLWYLLVVDKLDTLNSRYSLCCFMKGLLKNYSFLSRKFDQEVSSMCSLLYKVNLLCYLIQNQIDDKKKIVAAILS